MCPVNFSDHRARVCASTGRTLREEIVRRVADQLVLAGLERIGAEDSPRSQGIVALVWVEGVCGSTNAWMHRGALFAAPHISVNDVTGVVPTAIPRAPGAYCGAARARGSA